MSELTRAVSIAPQGDFVLPFDIAKAGVRGRLVRLDVASARAMAAHCTLPEAAARATGEALALSAILGTSLKLDGRLSVQTKSDGPLDVIAADYYGSEAGEDDGAESKPRGVRGFARVDASRLDELKDPSFTALAGKGSMAITIEPRVGGNSYQGIVALSPDGIAASAERYFAQSEQLPTVLRLAAAPLYVAGEKEPRWRAAGIMLQMTPESAKPGAPEEIATSDDWQRLSLILKTVEDLELLDTQLSPETVLWRLFHEDEVRVQPVLPIAFRCDCAPERIAAVLKSYGAQERTSLADPDGVIRARCEFCGTTHEIAPDSLS